MIAIIAIGAMLIYMIGIAIWCWTILKGDNENGIKQIGKTNVGSY